MKNETMKKIDISEYKSLVKEMLNDFHNLCVEKKLRYFVAYGTLIGAVRHNGFIPWDDDIDVCMPREDYEKLIEIVGKQDEKYYMLTPSNSKYYFNNFSRFCSRKGILYLSKVVSIDYLGPFIDVIPLDKVTSEKAERNLYYKTIRKLFMIIKHSLPMRYYRSLSWKGKIKMILYLPRNLFFRYFVRIDKLKQMKEEYITQYNSTDSDLLCGTFDIQSDKLLIYKSEIEKLLPHKFEDITVLIPSGYDTILTRIYGDYMKYPPVELQIAHHHFIPYWK